MKKELTAEIIGRAAEKTGVDVLLLHGLADTWYQVVNGRGGPRTQQEMIELREKLIAGGIDPSKFRMSVYGKKS